LEFIHGLLDRGPAEGPGMDGLLNDLAVAFAASGAGLAALATGKVLARRPAGDGALPWEEDAELTGRVLRAPAALSVPRPAGGGVLVTAIQLPARSGWLLWVEADAGRRAWSAAEAAALALAGQAVGRLLKAEPPGPHWAEQLGRAERQKDLETAARVSARLAHDFGNVLTGIVGFCDLSLALKLPAESQVSRYLRELQRCAQNGAQLTQLLRLFSRRQAGGVQPCETATVVAEEAARVAAAGGGFTVHTAVADGLPPVAVDAGQLRQVLAALLENARDAMQGAGAASVFARPVELTADDCLDLYGDARPGPHVEIAVADSGPGLTPDAARGLFSEPFFTAKPRRRGFGLAVSYGILHAHHGGLRLKSGPTGGTVAAVYLPAAAPARPTAAAPASRPVRGERILVVDDDAMILRFICATLEQAGYRVRGAVSAEEALSHYAAAAADRFRLVLSDVYMPKATGVDLARQLMGCDPGVRVLFMSGKLARDSDLVDFAAHGFEFLSKPFRTDGLLRAVRGAIDRTPTVGPRTPEGTAARCPVSL
jgi:signal transduction histidine kinase/ActR/RegA family two-component response regulator